MSSEIFIAYFGLKFFIKSEEIESLELRLDPRIIAARRVGLKYYWGNFGSDQDAYLMFIGAQLAIMGLENNHYTNMLLEEFHGVIHEISNKLIAAGFGEAPSFHFQLQLEQ